MKNSKPKNTFSIWITIILGVLTICAFILQIVTTGEKTTQLETALFSIIQFTLSIGFGWVLTRTVTKEEYEESTKKFAIGAYRRIADIEKMIVRLQSQVEIMRQDYKQEKYHALDVVKAIVVDINATIQSSISDWTDVIGDELLTLQQIQKLEVEKDKIISEPPPTESNPINERLEILEKNINILTAKLPARLRYQKQAETFDYKAEAVKLIDRHNADKGLVLTAFWDSTFELDPCEMKVGEKVFASVDSVNTRIAALIVKSINGKKVGVITNGIGSSYENFVHIMGVCFHESRFSAEIISMQPHQLDKKNPRHYFDIKVLDTPSYQLREKDKTG